MTNSPLLQLIEKILISGGIWKYKPSRYFKVFSILVRLFLWSYAISYVLYMKYAFFVIRKVNRERFIACLGTACAFIITALKIGVTQRTSFQKLFSNIYAEQKSMNESRYKGVRDSNLEITNKMIPLVRVFMISMLGVLVGLMLTTVVLTYMDHKNPKCTEVDDTICLKLLPYEFYLPFNVNDHYVAANMCVNIVGFTTGYILMAADLFILTSIVHIASKLKRLQWFLRNMHKLVGYEGTQEILYQNQYKFVRQCIAEHQSIMIQLNELNEILQYFLVFDFSSHSLVVATFLVAAISSAESVFYLTFMFGSACYILFQLFSVYYPAHILKDESVNVSMAIYESNWYETDVRTRNCLIIMMMRAQKPLKLSVGRLYDVDLFVFLKLLKTIYTFMTVFTNIRT